jgi:hypothetical protein
VTVVGVFCAFSCAAEETQKALLQGRLEEGKKQKPIALQGEKKLSSISNSKSNTILNTYLDVQFEHQVRNDEYRHKMYTIGQKKREEKEIIRLYFITPVTVN